MKIAKRLPHGHGIRPQKASSSNLMASQLRLQVCRPRRVLLTRALSPPRWVDEFDNPGDDVISPDRLHTEELIVWEHTWLAMVFFRACVSTDYSHAVWPCYRAVVMDVHADACSCSRLIIYLDERLPLPVQHRTSFIGIRGVVDLEPTEPSKRSICSSKQQLQTITNSQAKKTTQTHPSQYIISVLYGKLTISITCNNQAPSTPTMPNRT